MTTSAIPTLRSGTMTRTLAIAGFSRTTEVDADNVVSTSVAGAVALREAHDPSILRPLAGASVTLITAAGAIATNYDGKPFAPLATDAQGRFEFHNVAGDGDVHVLVDAPLPARATAACIEVVGCDAITAATLTCSDVVECIVHAYRPAGPALPRRSAKSALAIGAVVGAGIAREVFGALTTMTRHVNSPRWQSRSH